MKVEKTEITLGYDTLDYYGECEWGEHELWINPETDEIYRVPVEHKVYFEDAKLINQKT